MYIAIAIDQYKISDFSADSNSIYCLVFTDSR